MACCGHMWKIFPYCDFIITTRFLLLTSNRFFSFFVCVKFINNQSGHFLNTHLCLGFETECDNIIFLNISKFINERNMLYSDFRGEMHLGKICFIE